MVVHQPLRNAVLARNTDPVQVERNARENRVRAGAQTRASRVDRAVGIEQRLLGWIVERGIEVTHAVVGFVGVRHTVPAQAEVDSQPAIYAPVVLDV